LKKGENVKRNKNICAICGGRLKKEKISFDFRFNGELVVIDNLPVEVCLQCGEKVLSPAVSQKIDEVLARKKKPEKYINIPVYQISP
jgi:HTH-type transcriptional regulator/antitoxin MqsA